MPTGLVLTRFSNYYYVQADDGRQYQCFARALLKKASQTVRVGDRVTLQTGQDIPSSAEELPTAWITDIASRRNELTRPKIANVDQVLVVHPVGLDGDIPDLAALDRTLLHITLTGLPALIVISKVDLLKDSATWETTHRLYADQLGYTVIGSCIHQPDTLAAIPALLSDKTSVLAGISGAGKSSLLNALCPDWQLKTALHNTALGVHTTRHVQLLAAAPNSWVADTPGFRLMPFDKTDPVKLAQALPEAQNRDCEFDDCLHLDEAGCAVRPQMDPQRYRHYTQFQQEAAAYRETVLSTSQKDEGATKTLDRGGQQQLKVTRLKASNRAESRRRQKQSRLTDFLADTPDDLNDDDAF